MDTIDRSLLERFERVQQMREAEAMASTSDLAGGGGPPDIPGMEALIARVDGLEKRVEKVDGRLESIDARLRGVEIAVAGIGGKIDILAGSVISKLPSWWQMPAVIGSTVVLLGVLYGAAKHFHLAG